MAKRDGPKYLWEDFVQGCSEGRARVLNSAIGTARSDFNLHTPRRVVEWIGAGGLEKPEHANTEPWENNPDKENVVWVDSYNFYSGTDYGYVAFMCPSVSGIWMIKSLKKNDKTGPGLFQMAEAFRKAGLLPKK